MLKLNYSCITLFLLFFGFYSVASISEYGVDGREWSQPLSEELTPVALMALPYKEAINAAFFETSDNFSAESRSSVALAFAPCEEPIGSACDDGNPNTVNDHITADCECVGEPIAESCEDFSVSYQLDNGLVQSAPLILNINEGDSLALLANAEDYIITDENDLEVSGEFMTITPEDAGVYTISTIFQAVVPTGGPLLVTANSEDPLHSIANALDANPNTYWQSEGSADYPHEVVFDMGEYSILSGFSYLRRQDSSVGHIDDFEIYISNSASQWGDPVVQTEKFLENVEDLNGPVNVTFDAQQGRYLKFVAISPKNGGDAVASAAGFRVIRGPSIKDFSSQEVTTKNTGRARNAIDGKIGSADGKNASRWHTQYKPSKVSGPHHITLDLGVDTNLDGFEYTPRPDESYNGNILEFELFVSNDANVWNLIPDVEGEWLNNKIVKNVLFPVGTHGRYVKLKVKKGVGGFASAEEIKAIASTVNVTCSRTIELRVDPIDTYTFNYGWVSETPEGNSTINDIIIINSGNATVDGVVLGRNIIVQPGSSLTIAEAAVVTSTITLKSLSNSFSSLILLGDHIGPVNYERWVNQIGTSAGGGNDLVSSPVANVFFNKAFKTENPILPENPNNQGEFAFASYNVEAGAFQNFYIGDEYAATIPIVAGKGYRVATLAAPNKTGDYITFIGESAKGNVTIELSDAVAGRAWNAIGNPYSSYLDFASFFDENKDKFAAAEVYQAIYGYNGQATDKYEIWNLATTTPGDLLAPGQGFFVKAKQGGGTVMFKPEMRRVGDSDDFIAGRAESQNRALSALTLKQGNKTSATRIYFIDGTTRGLDSGYDAGVFTGEKNDFSVYTQLLEDHTDVSIAVQALPYEDFNNVVVPLGIKAKAGSELNITIDDTSTIPSHINVYLEDVEAQTFTLLNDGAYTFTLTSDMNSADRFNVHYSAKTLSTEDFEANNSLRIYTTTTSKNLYVKGQLNNAAQAYIYDIQGRLVLSTILNSNTTNNRVDIATVAPGIYVVKVADGNQSKTQKLVIN